MKKVWNDEVYYEDAQGKLVPEALMKGQDIIRDDLVTRLATKYLACVENSYNTKKEMLDEINQYRNTILLQYGLKAKTRKEGSPAITLTSFDGKYRIVIAANTSVEFNENITAAKELIDEYLNEELEGSSKDLKILVGNAFKMKQGKLDVNSILSLTRYDIQNEKFKRAVDIIKTSLITRTSQPSIRVYVRGKDGKYKYIELNFSTMEIPSDALFADEPLPEEA